MPSTYSTNLKLTLQATGENNGTWGTITNTNLGTLLEQSIVGAATVAMADANQTISITNGASSSGRCVYIKCTGALTATRNLIVPTLNKNYVVENATTGGQAITVKTAAGTGIAIDTGTKQYVYADGTNVVAAVNAFPELFITGNLTVHGDEAVSGGLTVGTAVNKVIITAPATGATLTIADGKTFTVSNTITLSGTDGASYNLDLIAPPAGVVSAYAGSSAPTGWLLCDGSSISQATYAALYAVIGTTYGNSGGAGTFDLPDLRGRIPAGRDNMGGSAANRLTSTTMTPDGTTLGATGGAQTSTGQAVTVSSVSVSGSTSGTMAGTTGGNIGTTGNVSLAGSTDLASDPHFHSVTVSGSLSVSATGTGTGTVSGAINSVQPSMIMNYIIKT